MAAQCIQRLLFSDLVTQYSAHFLILPLNVRMQLCRKDNNELLNYENITGLTFR